MYQDAMGNDVTGWVQSLVETNNLLEKKNNFLELLQHNPKIKRVGDYKFLFGIMNPRQLPHFIDSLKRVDYVDVFLAKNMPILQAERTIKDFFLDGDYDYLIFTSDDVEIPYLAPLRIMNDVDTFNFDVVTGWSKIHPDTSTSNITSKLPDFELTHTVPLQFGAYNFHDELDILKIITKGIYIIPVWFVGWSLTAISREVVEEWDACGWYFQESEKFKPVERDGVGGFDASTDLWFSVQTLNQGVKKYADLTVYVPHYPPGKQALLVGVKPVDTEFIPAKR